MTVTVTYFFPVTVSLYLWQKDSSAFLCKIFSYCGVICMTFFHIGYYHKCVGELVLMVLILHMRKQKEQVGAEQCQAKVKLCCAEALPRFSYEASLFCLPQKKQA